MESSKGFFRGSHFDGTPEIEGGGTLERIVKVQFSQFFIWRIFGFSKFRGVVTVTFFL